jgi:hypothetical protein
MTSQPNESDPMTTEVWRPIRDYVGYEVSSFGRVRSYWGKGAKFRRSQILLDSSILLKGSICKSGHIRVDLANSNNSRRFSPYVHTLVLEAFVGLRPRRTVACHFPDRDPGNNHVGNLRWDTSRSNAIDMVKHGTTAGQRFNETDIKEMWGMLLEGKSNAEIGRVFNVDASVVSTIKSGRQWSHVTSKLPGFPLIKADSRNAVCAPREVLDATDEIWKPVPHCSAYRVSSWGRIQSCLTHGKIGLPRAAGNTWKNLKCSPDTKGYPLVTGLRHDSGKRWATKVHVLVLTVFAGPRPLSMHGCHSDGNKQNNHISNLRWDTAQANAKERSLHATAK